MSHSSRSECFFIDQPKKSCFSPKTPHEKTLTPVKITFRTPKDTHFLPNLTPKPLSGHSTPSTSSLPSERYKIINELSKSDYFGEISLLTKLPVTSTVRTVSCTTLCTLTKPHFLQFVDNFLDCKEKLQKRQKSYNDNFFLALHRVLQNVPYICKLSYSSMRNIILKMSKKVFTRTSVI